MNLQNFFPYRLAVLAEAVSRSVAQVYTERFDLTRDEWRVLAALAECGAMKTVDLIAHTTLDKMPVSRAVTRLEGSGLVAREQDPDDRRNHVLRLQPPGQALVPLETYLRGRGLNPLADQFAKTTQAIDAAFAALGKAGKNNGTQVQQAARALSALKRLAEAEIAPALQVSIGFSDADGD